MAGKEHGAAILDRNGKIFALPLVCTASSSLKVEARIARGERPSTLAAFCVGSISVP